MKKLTLHVLDDGLPDCRFHAGPPGSWPFGHAWIRREEIEFNRVGIEAIRAAGLEPEEDLCEGCMAVDEQRRAP